MKRRQDSQQPLLVLQAPPEVPERREVCRLLAQRGAVLWSGALQSRVPGSECNLRVCQALDDGLVLAEQDRSIC